MRIILLCLFVAATASAQVPPFGAPFPLANTEYGTKEGVPRLKSDGRNAFLFWTDGPLRVTRLVPGENHIGRAVLDAPARDNDFDAVWTGEQFIVVAAITTADRNSTNIVGRLVGADGHAAGEPFVIVERADYPRLASNGTTILMLYRSSGRLESLTLRRDGRAFGAPERIADSVEAAAIVAAGSTRFGAMVSSEAGDALTLFDANGRLLSIRLINEHPQYRWSLASDGTRFLATFLSFPNATAMLFDGDGGLLRSLVFDSGDPSFVLPGGAVWTGSRWVIAYVKNQRMRVAELDASGAMVLSRQESDTEYVIDGGITAVGGRVVAAWRGLSTVFASDLPLAANPVEAVTYGAVEQQFIAAASSADATLVLWMETRDGRSATRAGVRTRDGSWREREIAPGYFAAMPASDGSEFVLVAPQRVTRLSANGVPLPGATELPPGFIASAVAWNGRAFAIAGNLNGRSAIAMLSRDGVLSAPKSFSEAFSSCPSIASDGDGFFALCYLPSQVIILGSPPGGLAGIRFDSSGQRLGEPIELTNTSFASGPGVAWDGRRYVAAWRYYAGDVRAAHIGAGGVEKQQIITFDRGSGVSVRGTDGGAWIGWSNEAQQFRVAFMRDDGTASAAIPTSMPPSVLTTFADGTVLAIGSARQIATPHYGASRVMMAVGTYALPPPADAPRLTVRRQNDVALLRWSPAAQQVNGYRLEYRVGDGLWLELGEWLDAEQQSKPFVLPWPDASWSFRVRAFNDAGAGAYSDPVSLLPMRRRAVR